MVIACTDRLAFFLFQNVFSCFDGKLRELRNSTTFIEGPKPHSMRAIRVVYYYARAQQRSLLYRADTSPADLGVGANLITE
jgi:hypothetical protein